MSDILSGLNQQQREAVTVINGALQVIAGAGSGKTLVLTRRIAYMLEQGVSPYKILALTFTNKAANEMKERISRLVNPEDANKIWAGTFHSIFARILRIEAEHIGFTRNFTIYDEEDSLKLIKQISDALDIKNTEIHPKAVSSIISTLKNKLINPEQYSRQITTQLDKKILEIYRIYQEELKRSNAMDFDDLLVNIVYLFKNQVILSKYQDRFQYILVDEYQDTNHVQYTAIKQLASHYQNICVVGDDAQSIYKWRGADISNILNFNSDYPYCKTVKLEQNYRSTGNILAAADSLISKNKRQLKKKLWTAAEDGEPINLLKLYNEKEEASSIISIIKSKHMLDDISLNNFAVLYRTNAQSLQFENACRAANLPYVLVGGVSFYRRKEIKDVLAYLRILVNERDTVSLYRVINTPPRGIGATTLKSISSLYEENPGATIVQILSSALDSLQLRTKTASALDKFINHISQYKELLVESQKHEFLFEYITNTGLLEYYQEIDEVEANERLANIEQLLNDIVSFMSSAGGDTTTTTTATTTTNNNNNNTLAEYLEQVTLISDLDTKPLDGDAITLMTLHSSKGLEFDNVFIPGIEHNLFPLVRANSDDDEEEERRLFYVGITRARKSLYLTYTENRIRFGNFMQSSPSAFLREITPDVFNDVKKNTFLTPKRDFNSLNRNNVSSAKKHMLFSSSTTESELIKKNELENNKISNNKYNISDSKPVFDDIQYQDNYSQIPIANNISCPKTGDVVKHSKFGTGRVLAITDAGGDKRITVQFSLFGRKQLLLSFAKLEILKN